MLSFSRGFSQNEYFEPCFSHFKNIEKCILQWRLVTFKYSIVLYNIFYVIVAENVYFEQNYIFCTKAIQKNGTAHRQTENF